MGPGPTFNKFVGRQSELELLDQALESARSAQMTAVIIGGEAGVGKTRLIRQFIEAAHGVDADHGSVISITGACRDYGESPLPFGVISEALRSLAAESVDSSIAESLMSVRNELSGLMPRAEVADEGRLKTTPPVSRSQLFEQILNLFESTAARTPLVVVIDDLQWADPSTCDLLAFLLANLTRKKIMFILAYRSDELLEGSPLLRYAAQMARQESVTRVTLGPLSYEELLIHLDDLGRGPVEQALASTIWERSQGNPFYAEELFAWASQAAGLPVSVRDALIGRIKVLTPLTQRVVRVTSAGENDCNYDVIAAVLPDVAKADLSDALREAVEHQVFVVQPNGTYAFRHALLREVAYSLLLPGERENVHAQFATALEPFAPSAAELARHYAESNNVTLALKASLDAAADAETSRGYAESHIHFERAVNLWPKVPEPELPSGIDLIELLDQCAAMSHLSGNNSRAIELLRSVLTQVNEHDPRRRVLRVHLGSYLLAAGESKEALTEHEAVVRELCGQPASSVHAEVLCAFSQTLTAAARHREAVRHSEEALAMARIVNDRIVEARALTTLGSNLVLLGQPETGAQYLQDALRLAEDLGRPGEIAAGYRNLAVTLSGPLNRLNEAFDVAQFGLKRVTQLGLERHWGLALQSIAADTLFRLGRWDEAVALVGEAIDRSARGDATTDLLLARAKLTVGRGDFASAHADLNKIAAQAERAIDLKFSLPLATLQAGLALWENDLDTGTSAVDRGLGQIEKTDDVWFAAPLVWHAMRVEAERAERARAEFHESAEQEAVARGEEFRRLSEEMCRSGRQQGALRLVVDAYDVMCEGELLRIRGDAAPDVWSVVAASWAELGQPYPTAYAWWRWAEALLSRANSTGHAAQLLRDAHAVALTLGAEPLRVELVALAHRARIDLQSPVTNDEDEAVVDLRDSAIQQLTASAGLTKREAEILALVADGKSNRGIAETCFISEKTASVHVSNILAKLNVQSRVQAAAMFHRATAEHV